MKPKFAKQVAKLKPAKPEPPKFETMYNVWCFEPRLEEWMCFGEYPLRDDANVEALRLSQKGYHVRIFKMQGD